MTNSKPKYLYKYRKIGKYTYDMLINDYLWCDYASTFNDPYEGYFNAEFLTMFKRFIINTVKEYVTSDQIKIIENCNDESSLNDYLKREIHSIRYNAIDIALNDKRDYLKNSILNAIHYIKNGFRICSLSETYDNRLMWAHYSNNHKGICIRYSVDDLGKNLHKVKYVEEMLDFAKVVPDNQKNIKTFANNVLTTKDSVWNYEKEWRLVFEDKKQNESHIFPVKPNAIFLGTNISKISRNKYKKLCQDKKIQCYELNLDGTKYSLIYNPIL